jgi:hypothetical protein
MEKGVRFGMETGIGSRLAGGEGGRKIWCIVRTQSGADYG